MGLRATSSLFLTPAGIFQDAALSAGLSWRALPTSEARILDAKVRPAKIIASIEIALIQR